MTSDTLVSDVRYQIHVFPETGCFSIPGKSCLLEFVQTGCHLTPLYRLKDMKSVNFWKPTDF